MEFQTAVKQKEKQLEQHEIVFSSLAGGLLGAHPCLTISFNPAYNYATTVPTRINWSSKPKHVYLYLNVIYLKCHVGVSII